MGEREKERGEREMGGGGSSLAIKKKYETVFLEPSLPLNHGRRVGSCTNLARSTLLLSHPIHRALMSLAAIYPSAVGTYASPSTQLGRMERELEVQVRTTPSPGVRDTQRTYGPGKIRYIYRTYDRILWPGT